MSNPERERIRPLDRRPCCACGFGHWMTVQPEPIAECHVCGLRRREVFPESIRVEERYAEAYCSDQEGARLKAMGGRVEILERCRLLGLERFVDVGCGPGFLLEALHVQGKAVVGVEINPHAREFMRLNGVPSVASLSELRPDDGWDVVMSWHFLEHIHDPRAAIADMFSLASRAVMAHVPTNHGEYQNPDHLWHFQEEHILRIFRDFAPHVDTFDSVYCPKKTKLKVTNLVGWIGDRS